MNLKIVLQHADEILAIAKEFCIEGLAIHNQGSPGMEEDENSNIPLGLVANYGELINKIEFLSKVELLLDCKVDLMIKKPADPNFNETVLLSAENLEAELINLFQAPDLAQVTFRGLTRTEKAINQGVVAKLAQKDSGLLFTTTGSATCKKRTGGDALPPVPLLFEHAAEAAHIADHSGKPKNA